MIKTPHWALGGLAFTNLISSLAASMAASCDERNAPFSGEQSCSFRGTAVVELILLEGQGHNGWGR